MDFAPTMEAAYKCASNLSGAYDPAEFDEPIDKSHDITAIDFHALI